MGATYEDSIKPSVYMFSVVQFLVDVLLDTNTTGGDRFLPVDLSLVSREVTLTKTAYRFVDDRPNISKQIQV